MSALVRSVHSAQHARTTHLHNCRAIGVRVYAQTHGQRSYVGRQTAVGTTQTVCQQVAAAHVSCCFSAASATNCFCCSSCIVRIHERTRARIHLTITLLQYRCNIGKHANNTSIRRRRLLHAPFDTTNFVLCQMTLIEIDGARRETRLCQQIVDGQKFTQLQRTCARARTHSHPAYHHDSFTQSQSILKVCCE